MNPLDITKTSNRRDFVQTLAVATGACLAPSAVRADDPKKEDEPKKQDAAKPKSEKTAKDSAASNEVEARMALVLARFGKHLDADARKSVRSEIESLVRRAETLRKFPLDNGDGPFPVFTPFRAAPE